MESTLPEGALERDREAIRAFNGEVFDFDSLDVQVIESRTGVRPVLRWTFGPE